MRKLIIGAAGLFVIYCIYWLAICMLLPSRLMPALQELRQDGLDIRLETPKITGFPSQFKTPLKQLQIVQYKTPLPRNAPLGQSGTFINPQLGFEYGLEIDSGTFSARAFWPMTQHISNVTSAILTLPLYAPRDSAASRTHIGAIKLDISLSGLKAKNIQIDGETISLTALNEADSQNIALKSIEYLELDYTYRKTSGAVNFAASGIGFDPKLLGRLGAALDAQVENMALDLDYTLRIDPDGQQNGQPLELMSASLENAALIWGKVQISAFGDIARNSGGLQGELTINIEQSADLLAQLRRSEAISPEQFFSAAMMLGSTNDTRSLSLTIRDNVVYIGPIRLTELPF